MAEYLIQSETLDDIVDAINAKTGGSSAMTPAEMVTAIENIQTGGGYDGLELVSTDSTTDKPSVWKWHGASVPNYALTYLGYSGGAAPQIDLSEVTDVGDYGLNSSLVRPINVQNIRTCGNAAFVIATTASFSLATESITFAELTGKCADGTVSIEIFRTTKNTYYQTIILPKFQYVGTYCFYQRQVPNSVVQIGSVGYPVLQCGNRPFGGSSDTGTVTVYTTGALLDAISAALQNQASASYTWIYKASEATEYDGVSYAAGDTDRKSVV